MNIKPGIVVITGGSSGIGLATASCFLKAGHKVAFCGRNAERLAQAHADLIQNYPPENILSYKADVLDEAQMNAFASAVAANFGGSDWLINNAGQGRISTFMSTTDQDWHDELELKYFSQIRPIRAFLALLGNSKCASITAVNSLLSLQPEPHMVATSSARAGIQNLLHSLAIEFAPKNIRVNSILVGLVESGQWRRRHQEELDKTSEQTFEQWAHKLALEKNIPLARLGKPHEAAQALYFLATPLSSYTTGSYLDVSGGSARFV
ncbi:sorbitol-6-phosphate 2-dehydrogenase [Gammaproteobacteria bacterium]|nr:sorbitol-6-phosphate 2-dehydrogenase [Gammaproteobacteria bacterium]